MPINRSAPLFQYDPSKGSFNQQLGAFYGFGPGAGGLPGIGGTGGGPTGAGLLTGAPPTEYDPTTGGKPGTPDPTKTAADALTGNIANIPGLSTLFNLIGGIYTGGKFGDLEALAYENARSKLAGEYNTPEAFRRTAELGSGGGLAGSDASQTAEILWHRRFEDEARKEGAGLYTDALNRSKGVLNLENLQVTPEQQQEAQYIANLIAASPNPKAARDRYEAFIREGINRGFFAGGGPGLGGGGGPTTLTTSTSPTNDILRRYGGGITPPPPGTVDPTRPSYGYLTPSDGGPGYGTTGGPVFTTPDTRPYLGPGGPPPYSSVNMPKGGWYSDMPYGGYESPGDVPYWWKGDPEDLVNPYL